jgi:hypothetical protein
LYDWLKQHPQAFLPTAKEPHFFNTDDILPGRYTLTEYERLFESAGPGHIAVGECSVWYLASNEAVPRIFEYNPDARLIVCVRNPIEMAFALHHQQVFATNEPLVSFGAAWDAQSERAKKSGWPAATSSHLLYGPMSQLGAQVERLKSRVPDERIHLIFLEDMKENPASVYRGILNFLGLSPFEPEFRRVNEAQIRRSPLIRKLVRKAGSVKRSLHINHSFGALDRVEKWNRKPHRWQSDPEMTSVLCSYFKDDIRLLGELTKRDLSHWLR